MFQAIKSYFSGQQSQPAGFVPRNVLDVLNWQNPDRRNRWPQPVATAHACVTKYTDVIASLPLRHFRDTAKGPVEVKSSTLVSFLRRPNAIQTQGQWLADGVTRLLTTGTAVALIERDGTDRPTAWWCNTHSARVDSDGVTWWQVQLPKSAGQRDPAQIYPNRMILRLIVNPDPAEPMVGRSPLEFCGAALGINSTLVEFLQSFLANRASPSYALATETALSKDQMTALRAAWDNQSQGENSGRTPILANGLKPVLLGSAPPDAMSREIFDLSSIDICRAFGIPPSMINAVPETAGNAQSAIRQWLASGLGSLLEQIEQAIEDQFLPPGERVEFDTAMLLRTSPLEEAQRIQALTMGGILSPDEARAALDLPNVFNGHGQIPRVQQQMVGLDLADQLHAATLGTRLVSVSENDAKQYNESMRELNARIDEYNEKLSRETPELEKVRAELESAREATKFFREMATK